MPKQSGCYYLDTNGFTGYLLNTSATSVLSIPSFNMFGEALSTAQTAVDQFINMSKSGNVEKVVIDLQQNTGGEVLLAFDVFKRFFPNIDPYGASRMRAHHAADVMGNSLTEYYAGLSTANPDYETLAADEWIATPRINAETKVNFTSWTEFYGSYEYNGDSFTAKVSPLSIPPHFYEDFSNCEFSMNPAPMLTA